MTPTIGDRVSNLPEPVGDNEGARKQDADSLITDWGNGVTRTSVTRSAGVAYQNNTDETLIVVVEWSASKGVSISISETEDGTFKVVSRGGSESSNLELVNAPVPPGWWYKISSSISMAREIKQ